MSDADSPNNSSENVAFVNGGVVGFFSSFFFWLILSSLIFQIFYGLGNLMVTVPLLAGLPFLVIVGVIYFILTQKPKGFILGLLIGAGFGLPLQGLCQVAFLVD